MSINNGQGAHGGVQGWYLLLCLVAGTGPFGDDVLLGLRVGREGEGDTGEGGALKDSRSAAVARIAARLHARLGKLTKSMPTISWALERPSPATSAMAPPGLYCSCWFEGAGAP